VVVHSGGVRHAKQGGKGGRGYPGRGKKETTHVGGKGGCASLRGKSGAPRAGAWDHKGLVATKGGKGKKGSLRYIDPTLGNNTEERGKGKGLHGGGIP